MENNNKIIWISSYPKSGNTWMRYLLANYFFNSKKIFDSSIINSIKKFPVDDVIQKIVKKDDLIKNPYNISKYWIKSQENLEIQNGNIAFLKNHNALVNINGSELTNSKYSLAAVYIVRDPRDVVVSYAHFKGLNYDSAIQQICSESLNYITELNENNFPRIEILGSWKFNYISWRDGISSIPRIIIRYEDLHSNCYGTFKKTISFLSKIINFQINDEQLKFSIDISNFKILQEKEKEKGFFENSGKSKFFRKGKVGNWTSELSKSQINFIESKFHKEMKFLNYL